MSMFDDYIRFLEKENSYWIDENLKVKKALEIAVDALKDFSIHPDNSVKKYANKALEQITALEQKDVK